MKQSITIRNAKYTDIDQMVILLKDLFSIESDFRFDYEKQLRGLRLMIDGCGKHRCVYVAVDGETLVGMCTAQTLISTAEGGLSALVEDMVVSTMWRGRKIGTQLLNAVEVWAKDRGIIRIQLLADRNNDPGLDFYRKLSLKQTDMICLRKRLVAS